MDSVGRISDDIDGHEQSCEHAYEPATADASDVEEEETEEQTTVELSNAINPSLSGDVAICQRPTNDAGDKMLQEPVTRELILEVGDSADDQTIGNGILDRSSPARQPEHCSSPVNEDRANVGSDSEEDFRTSSTTNDATVSDAGDTRMGDLSSGPMEAQVQTIGEDVTRTEESQVSNIREYHHPDGSMRSDQNNTERLIVAPASFPSSEEFPANGSSATGGIAGAAESHSAQHMPMEGVTTSETSFNGDNKGQTLEIGSPSHEGELNGGQQHGPAVNAESLAEGVTLDTLVLADLDTDNESAKRELYEEGIAKVAPASETGARKQDFTENSIDQEPSPETVVPVTAESIKKQTLVDGSAEEDQPSKDDVVGEEQPISSIPGEENATLTGTPSTTKQQTVPNENPNLQGLNADATGADTVAQESAQERPIEPSKQLPASSRRDDKNASTSTNERPNSSERRQGRSNNSYNYLDGSLRGYQQSENSSYVYFSNMLKFSRAGLVYSGDSQP